MLFHIGVLAHDGHGNVFEVKERHGLVYWAACTFWGRVCVAALSDSYGGSDRLFTEGRSVGVLAQFGCNTSWSMQRTLA